MADEQSSAFIVGGHFASSVPTGKKSRYRDPIGLTRILQTFLVLMVLLTFAVLWSEIAQFSLLQAPFTNEMALSNDERQKLISIVHVIGFVLTAIVFASWINRVAHNARGLGARNLTVSTGWAVGWYFIPLASLWMPFVAMREIWNASRFPSDWSSRPVPPTLVAWWACWIGATLLGDVSAAAGRGAHTIAGLTFSTQVAVIAVLGQVLMYVAALVLVTRLCQIQTAQRSVASAASVF